MKKSVRQITLPSALSLLAVIDPKTIKKDTILVLAVNRRRGRNPEMLKALESLLKAAGKRPHILLLKGGSGAIFQMQETELNKQGWHYADPAQPQEKKKK